MSEAQVCSRFASVEDGAYVVLARLFCGFEECNPILNAIVKVDYAFWGEAVLGNGEFESDDVLEEAVVAENGICF